MNAAVNKLSDKSSVIDELTVDGVKITNPDSIANSLGKYFATVGNKFAQRIASPVKSVDEYIKKYMRPQTACISNQQTKQRS